MGNVQHTPGPWAVFNGTDIFPFKDYGGKNHIASTDPAGNHPTSGGRVTPAEHRAELEADPASNSHIPYREAQANARLIAAAPELLEAIKLALPYLQDLQTENYEDLSVGIFADPELTRCFESVKAAIAKATGQAPETAK